MDDLTKLAKKIFLAAVRLNPAEREPFIERSTRSDPALRRAVDSLLGSYKARRKDSLIRRLEKGGGPPPNPSTIQRRLEAPLSEVLRAPPPSIPGHRILREIGRGGRGVVYEAFQESPPRKVALKVLFHRSDDAGESARRFEREIRISRRLVHAGIARVHDGGLAGGRFFFTMELIEGEPIEAHARRRGLSTEEVVRLFQKVCAAVGHTHAEGIIHRDLKPSSILVDRDGAPHVIGFGIGGAFLVAEDGSRLVAPRASGGEESAIASRSPEQAGGWSEEIDARSDVYSLGAVLYLLLTGHPPSPPGDDRNAAPGAAAEEELRPPAAVRPTLPDDLQNIILKALEKEPDRRYQTAEAMAQDLARHLRGEPVTAKGRTSRDFLGRLLRRMAKG